MTKAVVMPTSPAAACMYAFEEVPEGTKLTWSSDISFKGVVGKILSLFGGSKLKDFSARTLDELAKYVEAQQAKTQ